MWRYFGRMTSYSGGKCAFLDKGEKSKKNGKISVEVFEKYVTISVLEFIFRKYFF
jgi:hypothetical protein